MNLRDAQRTAVDTYLRLVRAPLDGAIRLLPGNGTGAKPAARLALDRGDAQVRAVISAILRDRVLREDAEKRREAANERARAARLRTEAERESEHADSRLAEREEQATRRREQANKRAETRRREAAQTREKQRRQATSAASQRTDAVRAAAKHTEEVIDQEEPKAQLESLNARDDALREKEKELTVRDEARRLADSASNAKAERKDG